MKFRKRFSKQARDIVEDLRLCQDESCDKAKRDRVIAASTAFLSEHPEDFIVGYALGKLYLETKDPTNARSCFKAVLDQHPSDFPTLANDAKAILALLPAGGEARHVLLAEAREKIASAARIHDERHLQEAWLHAIASDVYFQSEQYPEALRHALKANQLQPDTQWLPCLKNLADIGKDNGAYEAACAFAALPDLPRVRPDVRRSDDPGVDKRSFRGYMSRSSVSDVAPHTDFPQNATAGRVANPPKGPKGR